MGRLQVLDHLHESIDRRCNEGMAGLFSGDKGLSLPDHTARVIPPSTRMFCPVM